MLEQDIKEYLILHKDGIKAHLDSLATEAKNNPILSTFFKEAQCEELIQYLALQLNASYPDIAEVVDEELIDKWLKM